ncbi:hypothetical protein BS585_17200 [Vibrio parahaemolyticus]|nr:hypothetical protein BS585_17200 [Vibrio parahaemolyticus]
MEVGKKGNITPYSSMSIGGNMQQKSQTQFIVNYIQNEIRSFVQQQSNQIAPIPETYNHLDSEQFFDMIGCPDCHEYSDYFKQRLFEFDKKRIVRPAAFARDLRIEQSSENSNSKPFMYQPNKSQLRCLKPYVVHHHHIEGYYDSFCHNMINALKNRFITPETFNKEYDEALKSLHGKLTGHWVIYIIKEDGSRLYLDVVKHASNGYLNSEPYDADSYLKTTGLENYRSEFPTLFPIN